MITLFEFINIKIPFSSFGYDNHFRIMYTEEPKYKRMRTEDDESRKMSLTKKSFNPNWLKFTMFKDWLMPHKLPDKAVCKVCHCVLVAGKSELEKHLATRKHERNMEKINGSPAEQDDIETYTIISGRVSYSIIDRKLCILNCPSTCVMI